MESHIGLRFTAIGLVVGLSVLFLAIFDFNWGIDLKGGYTVTYGLEEPTEDETAEDQGTGAPAADRVSATIKVMQKRVNKLGLADIKFIPEGTDRIKVQLPGADQAEANRTKDVLTQLGELELRLVATEAELQRAGVDVAAERIRREAMETRGAELDEQGIAAPVYSGPEGPAASQFAWHYNDRAYEENERVPSGPGEFIKLGDEFGMAGSDISRVYSTRDNETGFPAVGFGIKPQSRGKLSQLTRANQGRNLAIILNGRVNSAPEIQNELSDGGIIRGGAGGFRADEVEELIATLQSGSLDFKPELLSEDLIGPTLGEDAIRRGGLAMMIGLAAIAIFMLVHYRLAGIIANLALMLTLLIMMGALLLFSATLTLPGIAGIVLTVGMAVDANILIFERIREERDKGKTLIQSVKNGYEQAFRAIFDSNVTTLATAIILVLVGTEIIKGFGVTLALGIVSSMFSALFATKTIFLWLIQKGMLKELSMMRLIGTPKIDFLRFTGPATILSIVLVIGGLAIFFSKGDDKYSIDFTGGGVVQVRLQDAVALSDLKDRVASLKDENGQPKYPDADVRTILVAGEPRGTSSRFEITSKIEAEDADSLKEDLKTILANDLLPEGIPFVGRIDETDESVDEALRGGFRVELTLPDTVDEATIRDRMRSVHLAQDTLAVDPDAARSSSLSGNWKAYTIQGRPTLPNLDEDALTTEIHKAFVGENNEALFPEPIPKATTIGKVVAKDLKNKAIIAMFLSLVFMIYYIRIRFHEYRYGLAAAACLVHDVIVTLGLCVLFNSLGLVDVKISYAIIAVFLTIVGYSLNDTIVIFDRVRENLHRPKGTFVDTINRSINQTLSRTILTSLTTLFVVVVLFALNYGQKSDLEGFAFALIIGILSGTYSTIYVASPVVIRIGKYLEAKKASEPSTATAS